MVQVRFHEVVIDCADPIALRDFWQGFTGWAAGSTYDDWCSLDEPGGHLKIGFQKVPESKVVKNRVHIDWAAADEEATAQAIEAMGATRRWVSENPDDPFVVLADPEGNEFCIVRER